MDAPFVSGVVVSCQCHRESRPQEGGGIAQAWATWPEGASAPNGTMKCRGHGVPEMVTPASRTTAVLLVYAMFSFAMTSGLAWQVKFKIIITLRRAQKFGDTGPYKNFDFLFNRLPAAIFSTEGIFTMFPNGNSRWITVKLQRVLLLSWHKNTLYIVRHTL